MAKTLIGIFSLSIVVAILVIPTSTAATTPSPTTDTPTTPSPTTDTSATPSPTTDTPTTPSPATDTPTTPSPTTDTPTTPSPATDTPTTPSPATDTPTTPSPTIDTPTTPSPTTDTPDTLSPTTDTPATPSPITDTSGTKDSKTTEETTETGSPPTVDSTTLPVTGSSPTKDPNATPTTAAPATTSPPSACASNPCLEGSTCEERADPVYICLCLTGDVYTGTGCLKSKVFPGLITLTEQFDDNMSDKTSAEFQKTSESITNELGKEFNETGYLQSLVLELRESKQSKGRSTKGNIEASVQVMFEQSTDITDETVNKRIKEKVVCETCPLEGTYSEKDLCASSPCDSNSTKCKSGDGDYACQCEAGFFPTQLSDRLCIACPPIIRMTAPNVSDKTLILVIVASIFGGLLLIALILLPLVATKFKKKSSKSKKEDNVKPYFSHSVAKAPVPSSIGFSSSSVKKSADSPAANSWGAQFPRAKTSTNWDSRANLEMTPSNSRQNLIASGKNSRFNDSQDDMYSFSQNQAKSNPYSQVQPKSNPYDQVQPKSNPYAQVQPTTSLYSQVLPNSNPYAQNRATSPYAQNRATNPYAQSRGQTNPYFN